MPPLYHKYRHLSRGILIKICTNRGNFLRSSFPFLATRLAASPWRMLNYQIFKDQCRDFRERPASRLGAFLSALLPHYTSYRLFVNPLCTILRDYLGNSFGTAFARGICRKSLVSKELGQPGTRPADLSPCVVRTYNYSEKIGKMSIDRSSSPSSSCWISDMQAISSHSRYSD